MRLPEPVLKRARIEIIPMIDTIFFLLVFFMITWLSMVKMSGLPLTLPRENESAGKPPQSITLSVSPQGNFYVDSHRTTSYQWTQRMRAMLRADPDGIVVVNVAPEQKTQTLVSIIDAVSVIIRDTHASAHILVATPRVRVAKVPGAQPKEIRYVSR